MVFDHRVHHTDPKGNIRKITPYTKVCREGYPEIYFDHVKKRFFNPGDMKDADLSRIPEDIKERYLGKKYLDKPNKVRQKPGPKKGFKKAKVVEKLESDEPIVIKASNVEE